MRFDVVTLFPQMVESMIGSGVTGRAVSNGLVELSLWNPRDYTSDTHRSVDDRPYGGGPGMVMLAEPLRAAISAAREAQPGAEVAYLSPQGRRLDQAGVSELAGRDGIILVAGRYEGVDERLIDHHVDEEWSIGDYVLSGGELPALVLMDSVIRLLPGVLGDDASAEQDSYMDGLLDCPHYTRPERFEDEAVPEVLRSGDHAAIRRWRLQQSLGRTWLRRPEMLVERDLSAAERSLLEEFITAHNGVD